MTREKFEAIAAGTAHDLGSLLTVIMASAYQLEQSLSDDPESLAELHGLTLAAQRGAALVRSLLCAARKESLGLEPVPLETIVPGLRWTLRRLLPAKYVVTVGAQEPLPPVLANVAVIEQVVANLVTNARDAMPSGGVVRVTMRAAKVDGGLDEGGNAIAPGEYVQIDVIDEGFGLDDATRVRMFEPFFTTKPPKVGSGLGLAMVRERVREHCGAILVSSRAGRGTTVSILLPVASRLAPVQQPG